MKSKIPDTFTNPQRDNHFKKTTGTLISTSLKNMPVAMQIIPILCTSNQQGMN